VGGAKSCRGGRHRPAAPTGSLTNPHCLQWLRMSTMTGMPATGLPDPEELEVLLREHAARTAVVGAAVAMAAGNEQPAAHVGMADRERGLCVVPETRFQIGSVTKTMVATVVIKLAGQGRLQLDDPVVIHVPELGDAPWGRCVTVRHLLSNTGGIPPGAAAERFSTSGDDCLARLAADLATQPLLFEPGSAWSYGNTSWSLAGRIIETVCGTVWEEEAMQAELFTPAGGHQQQPGPRTLPLPVPRAASAPRRHDATV
jgi:CubicO group peptidase (beta-lactamase class C family)